MFTTERHREVPAVIGERAANWVVGSHIPELDLAVLADGGECLVVRTERDCIEARVMVWERVAYRLMSGYVPQFCSAVIVGGGEDLTV